MSQQELKAPKPSLFAKAAISAAVVGLLAPLSAAAAEKASPKNDALLQQFGLVHVGAGQGLRVNIAYSNPPGDMPGNNPPDGNCDVTAKVFAADGTVLVQQQGRLAPGASHVLDFDPRVRVLTAARNTVALRASVAAANPPDGKPERVTPCAVVSTLEVYDGASGETRVITLPGLEMLVASTPR